MVWIGKGVVRWEFTWLQFIFWCITTQNYIPFNSTLFTFSHMCRHFYFRVLYHSMRQKRLACWFCFAYIFFWLFYCIFFHSVCFILIFQLAVHLPQISYCMHTCTYQVSHNANVLCCNGCLGKCCMLIAMQCFKVKWLKNDIRQLTLILLVLNHLQFEYTATSTFR